MRKPPTVVAFPQDDEPLACGSLQGNPLAKRALPDGAEAEGRIALSAAMYDSLAIARGRDSAADPAPVRGVFPSPRPSPGQAPEDRPGGRDRASSLADIADKGAFTGRMGYAHPTAAPGPARTPSQGLRP